MKSRHIIFRLVSLALVVASVRAQTKPNIVFFYIDDWAWNGSPVAMDDAMANSRMPIVQMPNVQRLAAQGMKFRNAYGSPQCSPARVCVQTGQSAPRSGFTVYMNPRDPYFDTNPEFKGFPVVPTVSDREIDEHTPTIAEALKPLGYVSAHIGKWHMRGDPGKKGYAVHDGDTDNKPGNTLRATVAEGAPMPRRLPEELSDPKLMFSITRKAIGFIEQQARTRTPFYVQISHYAMHAGRECLDTTREKYARHPLVRAYYQQRGKTSETINRNDDPAIWLGMAEDLDGRIGAVLDRLKALGIDNTTYVVLAGDNGYRHEELQLTPGLTQPLHSRKWWLWDGGIRVPMIVKGPGIKPGSSFAGNVVNYDFLPTFVDWAGGDPRKLANIDGVSLAAYMAGRQPDSSFLNRHLYFHYPHYRTSVPHSVVISGFHKVVHFYERPELPMLFDLSKDIGEVNNVAPENPETHRRLLGEMMRYFKEVGARIPKTNPNYDPAVYQNNKDYSERALWGPFTGKRPLEKDEK